MKHWRVPRPLESSLQSLPKLRLGLRFTAKLGIRLWNASCSDSGLYSWHTASPVRRAFLPTAQPAGRGPSFRSSLRRKKKRLLFAGSFVLVLHSKLRSCCYKQLCGRDAFVRSAFLFTDLLVEDVTDCLVRLVEPQGFSTAWSLRGNKLVHTCVIQSETTHIICYEVHEQVEFLERKLRMKQLRRLFPISGRISEFVKHAQTYLVGL